MSARVTPRLPTFEPRWPAALAVLVAIGLYASLPSKLISNQHASGLFRVVVPALELALLVPLALTAPHRHIYESGRRRKAAISLIAIVSIANVVTLAFLINLLVKSGGTGEGRQILIAAAEIWWTNVIVFGLWYWELDGGGPPRRLKHPGAPRDFAFVQMTDPRLPLPAGTRASSTTSTSRSRTQAPSAHRHDAADPLGEAADACPVGDFDHHAAARRRTSGQHPPLTSLAASQRSSPRRRAVCRQALLRAIRPVGCSG